MTNGELVLAGKGMADVFEVSAKKSGSDSVTKLPFLLGGDGSLRVSTPSDFTPGVYDLMLSSRTYGNHTVIGGLVVRDSLIEEMSFHMKSGWVDAETQAAISAFVTGKAELAKKIHCLVNGPARAADLALNACDVIKTVAPTAAEFVASTRNTYTKTGSWLRIWISY